MDKNDKQRPLVSVCISVHNTEKWLPRCLDSVVNQTLDNLEIVLVNNGSTDSSASIMLEYKQKYPKRRFVIVSQEDRGLAQGRQSGVVNATGQYIAFLDADDYVDVTTYEDMYKRAVLEKVDIVEMQTRRKGKILSSNKKGRHDSHSVLLDFFEGKGVLFMVWTRLYKRELFEKKDVFPNLYTNNEDNFATPCLLYAASSIYFLDKPLHTYSDDNENAVTTKLLNDKNLNKKLFRARSVALNSLIFIRNFMGVNVDEDLLSAFEHYRYQYIYSYVFQIVKGVSLKERLLVVDELFKFKGEDNVIDYLTSRMNNQSSFYRLYKLVGFNMAFRLWILINKQ